jgi:hypothetical protein
VLGIPLVRGGREVVCGGGGQSESESARLERDSEESSEDVELGRTDSVWVKDEWYRLGMVECKGVEGIERVEETDEEPEAGVGHDLVRTLVFIVALLDCCCCSTEELLLLLWGRGEPAAV